MQINLLKSNYSPFDAPQEGKYDGSKINAVCLLSPMLLQKTFFLQKRLFLEFLLPIAQTIDLRLNLRACLRKSVKRAIECAFPGCCSSSGSRVMCRFVEKF